MHRSYLTKFEVIFKSPITQQIFSSLCRIVDDGDDQFTGTVATLRSHGMTNASLHIIYRAVVVAKLMYAASAWWSFTTAADRQRLDAVIRRTKRSCLCSSDLPSLAELIDNADDDFFNNILSNPHHVLHSTLPKETASSYALRRRRHNRELLDKSSRLVQSCFVVRMLYKDI